MCVSVALRITKGVWTDVRARTDLPVGDKRTRRATKKSGPQTCRGFQGMEAIWVAAEMRAGGAYAHSVIALDTIARKQAERASDREQGASVSGVKAREQSYEVRN